MDQPSTTSTKIAVIIPALNEELSISKVINAIPKDQHPAIIVADNGSTDRTAEVAYQSGAVIVDVSQKGYGYACLAGIAKADSWGATILVFLDGDYSDYPEEMGLLLAPILEDSHDFVLGSRLLGNRQKGAMPWVSMCGNTLAGWFTRIVYGFRFTDLGPFRAIRMESLKSLHMRDKTYGWTIEMQIKALRKRLRILEIPVSYRKRIGKSKVSGTIKGVILASIKILFSLIYYSLVKIK